MGMTTFENGWWYNETYKMWEFIESGTGLPNSQRCAHQPCCSVKAFRRKLKDAPEGVEFILVSRFVGHDVFGKGKMKYASLEDLKWIDELIK